MKNKNERICQKNCKDINGNCKVLGSDGSPVQCVGPWAENKYFFLERYLNASCEARKKFADRGNAVFIDLFSGPGKCIIRDIKKEINSGGIRALKRDRAPFNEHFFFDISEENVKSLEKRIEKHSNCHIKHGDSNVLITELVEALIKKPYKNYHFAFIDPFGPEGLKFNTLRELAKLERVDMLIHFPIGAIKRNIKVWLKAKDKHTILDEFLGTAEWREFITSKQVHKDLLNLYMKQLISIGYPQKGLKMLDLQDNIYDGMSAVPIKNTRQVNLYYLILASKHQLAQTLWNKIIQKSPNGQQFLWTQKF